MYTNILFIYIVHIVNIFTSVINNRIGLPILVVILLCFIEHSCNKEYVYILNRFTLDLDLIHKHSNLTRITDVMKLTSGHIFVSRYAQIHRFVGGVFILDEKIRNSRNEELKIRVYAFGHHLISGSYITTVDHMSQGNSGAIFAFNGLKYYLHVLSYEYKDNSLYFGKRQRFKTLHGKYASLSHSPFMNNRFRIRNNLMFFSLQQQRKLLVLKYDDLLKYENRTGKADAGSRWDWIYHSYADLPQISTLVQIDAFGIPLVVSLQNAYLYLFLMSQNKDDKRIKRYIKTTGIGSHCCAVVGRYNQTEDRVWIMSCFGTTNTIFWLNVV